MHEVPKPSLHRRKKLDHLLQHNLFETFAHAEDLLKDHVRAEQGMKAFRVPAVDLTKLIKDSSRRSHMAEQKERFKRGEHGHFQVLKVNAEAGQRLGLYDKQMRILAYLFPLSTEIMETLEASYAGLPTRSKPKPKSKTPASQARSQTNVIRHYAAWGKYATHRYYNAEFHDDWPHSEDFAVTNTSLFECVDTVLKFIAPDEACIF